MNLTTLETQTVIMALREYREHWNNEKDKKSFDQINHIMRRFQLSLNSKAIYKEYREKKMKAGEKELYVDDDDEVTHTRVIGTKEWIPVKKIERSAEIKDH